MNIKIALIDSNCHNRPLSLYTRQILEALGELFSHQFEFIMLNADLYSEDFLQKTLKEVVVILSDVPEDQLPQEFNQFLRKKSSLFNRKTPYEAESTGYFSVCYSGIHKNLYYPLLLTEGKRGINDFFWAILETTALLLEKNLNLSNEANLLKTAMGQVNRAENLTEESFKSSIETEQLHRQLLDIIRSDQWLPEETYPSKKTNRKSQQVF